MLEKYRTGDIIRFLGITRDTLRFYEEKGLLAPAKDRENQYRGFDVLDAYKLMIIDFLKKRGMNLNTIGTLLKDGGIDDMRMELAARKEELIASIEEATAMLRRIEETEAFSRDLESRLGVFVERPMPPLRILGELSDFGALEEYADAREIFAADTGDMLSKIVRHVSFDEVRILDTRMLITKPAASGDSGPDVIGFPDCLYYVAEEYPLKTTEEDDLIHSMHNLSREYAAVHGYSLTGEAFATIRLITFDGGSTRAFIEIYIPFARKGS